MCFRAVVSASLTLYINTQPFERRKNTWNRALLYHRGSRASPTPHRLLGLIESHKKLQALKCVALLLLNIDIVVGRGLRIVCAYLSSSIFIYWNMHGLGRVDRECVREGFFTAFLCSFQLAWVFGFYVSSVLKINGRIAHIINYLTYTQTSHKFIFQGNVLLPFLLTHSLSFFPLLTAIQVQVSEWVRVLCDHHRVCSRKI